MKKIIVAGLLLFSLTFISFGTISVEAQNYFEGKIIALDAGHGGAENGAINQTYGVAEKDVNLAVVYTLKNKLEADNNLDGKADNCVVLTRVCDETISSRKERVGIAKEKCKSECGGECDVLVSVHHNGSTDPTYDGLLVIYNEKQDKPLAIALHDALWNGLTKPIGYVDEGLDWGGYGMTVYGHLVSALTEGYYITNDWEAKQYFYGNDGIYGNNDETATTETAVCTNYSILVGDRINEEVNALYQGLFNYFSIPPKKPGRK